MDNETLVPSETPENRAELMEFYKTYLGSIEVTTNRRQQSNQFFIGLLTALLGIVGLIFNNEGDGFTNVLQGFLLILSGLLGLLLSAVWLRYIRSSVLLNKVKFEILDKMEDRLSQQPFREEYQLLKKRGYVGLGRIEGRLPWMMMVPYVIILGFGIALTLS